MANEFRIEDEKILFTNNNLFKLLKPIADGSHSNIYKARLDKEMSAIKKYKWTFQENQESIERKLHINIYSYITPQKILYIKDKFEGYIMKFCNGGDLSKRKLDISIDEFSTSLDKLMEDTDKLSKIKHVIYDTYITNVMYDGGFRMIDTDDYFYYPNKSFDEISHENMERLNKMLVDIFIKNTNLGNLYFNNVEFLKFGESCKKGEFLFKEMFDLLCGIAQNEANGELVKVSEVGKVLSKVKKM